MNTEKRLQLADLMHKASSIIMSEINATGESTVEDLALAFYLAMHAARWMPVDTPEMRFKKARACLMAAKQACAMDRYRDGMSILNQVDPLDVSAFLLHEIALLMKHIHTQWEGRQKPFEGPLAALPAAPDSLIEALAEEGEDDE